MHLGRKAAAIIAPDTPRPCPLKSAPVIEVCIVAVLLLSSPLKMNCDRALIFWG
jgi:hypothetical protein